MSAIIKKLAQSYIGRLSADDLAKITTKLDTQTPVGTRNPKFGGEDYPVPKSQYVHRHELIAGSPAVHFTNAAHRVRMAYYHPWMKGYLEKVSKALWSTPPLFCKPAEEDKADPEEDEQIKTFWNENRLQDAVKKSWLKSMIHGICFLYPMDRQTFFDGYSGPAWAVYSSDELGQPAQFIQGHPYRWQINPSNKELMPFEATVNQGIFYDFKNTDDFTGEPFGLGIWDLLVDWIWITDAVNAFDQRLGNGFLTIVVPNATTADEISEYEETIKNTRTEKGLVIRGTVDEPVEVNWVGMSGMQVDFIKHLEKLEDLIAFNMGFPKRWIMGDAEGAMESSGEDALQVNIQLKNLFNEWVMFIKRILLFYGQISSFDDIIIKPPFELQLSEQEQTELRLMKAQLIAMKTWLTVNEQRAEDGYEDIEGGDTLFESNAGADAPGGDVSNEMTSMMSTRASPGAKQFQSSAKAKSDTEDLLAQIFTDNTISVRQLADLCGVSPTTVSKMREKFDAEGVPHYKEDELVMKADAVALNEDLYEIEDVPVVLPQEKHYENLGYTAIRPREEIERIFNDPKYPKEFRIGVTPSGDHSSRIPLEVLNENTVGMVQFKRLDEEGNIRANIRYSLSEADRILGKDNFIRTHTMENIPIPTSVALYSRDRKGEKGVIERDLDVRSFVFTQTPRNPKAGGI